ncbi:MAG: type IV pilus twitching motility protein PilT [Armatimonadota bacterium]
MTETAQEKKMWRRTVKAPKELVDRVGESMNDEIMEIMLEGCAKIDASDLHLTVGQAPVYRVHGTLHEMVGYREMTHEDMVAGTNFFLGEDTPDNQYWVRFHEKGGADHAYSLGDIARFRVSVFQQREHPALALRMIPHETLTFEQLGLDPEVQVDLLSRPRGLILLTGPTGCGKSTTIASMIDWINENRGVHIVTIEEPIEFFHESKMALINQREVGVDVDSFAEAVIRNMRSDPDIILVGEMRDLETMRAALQAAETGHLVFATLHTVSAPKTVDRLVTAFPASEQEEIRAMVSTSLVATFSQELIPRIDKRGRIAAHEIMIGEAGGSPAIGNLVRERKVSQMRTTIQSSKDLGMQLLESSMARLVNEGKIDFWEGYNRSNAKSDFMMFVDEEAIPDDVSQQLLQGGDEA